jgi:tyrosine-protein kinase
VTNDDAPALNHLLRLLRRGIWIIALAAGATTAGAVYFSLRQPPRYEASAEVYLRPQNVAASVGDVVQPTFDPQRQADTQARLARVRAVAEAALEDAGAQGRDADDLLDDSSVSTPGGADFLTFSVTDSDPEMAAKLATAYARAYTEYRDDIDGASLIEARREIEQEMRALEARGEQGSPLYAELAAKNQSLRTTELLQTSNALLVRPADRAEKIQPKPVRDGVLAGLFGLGFGVALAFLADAVNTRVRNAEEVQERLGLPLLARVRESPRELDGRRELTMLAHPRGPDAEAFRILATNLDLANVTHPTSKILTTSALRGDGKSMAVANLAVAFARGGRRIVLVDLDLRSPSIDRLFLLPPDQPGLTHVALGRITLEDALVRIPIIDSNHEVADIGANGAGILEVLPSGSPPPNPAEFIASAHSLNEIIWTLETEFDLVLIDAPPLLEASDAITLSTMVDGILIVTRIGRTPRPVLNELRRVLDSAPVRKLGFVATGAKGANGYVRTYAHRIPEEHNRLRERERFG